MNNKKAVYLVIGLLTLISLCFATYWIMFEQNKKIVKIRFNFEDIKDLNKIRITDAYSNTFTLIKSSNTWTDEKGNCVNQECVDNILEATEKIHFKSYLNQESEKTFYRLMQTNCIKVEFYEKGVWSKSWYIGPSAQDHNGQIMMLDAPNMRNKRPVIMALRGIYGIIQPRFFTDPKQWICTNIFSLEVDEIESIEVNFTDEPYRNFEIKSKGNSFEVTSNKEALEEIDTLNVFRYLQKFKKVHFEGANYSLNESQQDSLKSSDPFCTLTVQSKDERRTLKMFRIKIQDPQENEFGQMVNMDLNRFWCELDDGQIVKCQYFVFNPLILGNVYFPAMNRNFPILNSN